MIDIELQRARSAMAESVTLPIAMWLEALDELEALRQTRLVQQAEQEPVAIVEDWPTDSTPKGIVALCDIKKLPAGTLLYASPATSTEVFTREKVDSLLIAAYTKGRNDLLEKQAEQRSDSERMEPVAWALSHSMGLEFGSKYPIQETKEAAEQMARQHMGAVVVTPLYAAPVRTKDLTDDEIDEIRIKSGKEKISLVYFARAVIAADREKNK